MTPPATNIRVVRATRKHVEMLTDMFESYLVFYRRTPDRDAIRAFLTTRIARKESAIFVALDASAGGAEPVGFAQLYPTFSSLRLSRVWVLNDIFTVPGRRRSGVAHLLLSAARTMALGTSSSHVELLTERTNHAAQRVYESAGFRRDETSYRYEQELTDAEHPAMPV